VAAQLVELLLQVALAVMAQFLFTTKRKVTKWLLMQF